MASHLSRSSVGACWLASLAVCAACETEIEDPDDLLIAEPVEPATDLEMIQPEVRADLAPGMIYEVDGVGAVVPEPGEWVIGVFEGEGGAHRTIRIATRLDGTVLVDSGDELQPDQATYACGLSQCTDPAYSHLGYRTNSYGWYFKKASTPSYLGQLTVETEIRSAVNAITGVGDGCSLPDNVSATNTYRGSTTASANIGYTTCTTPDAISVVDFSPLGVVNGASLIGAACAFSNGTRDVTLDSERLWFVSYYSGCSNRFHIRGVMTHEAGHVFGLGHVSASCSPNLTMKNSGSACETGLSTLGRGDVRGLEALY